MIVNRKLIIYSVLLFIVVYYAINYFNNNTQVNEYMTVSEDALSTIASVYNTGNLTANNITATQSLTSGPLSVTGNVTATGTIIGTTGLQGNNISTTPGTTTGGQIVAQGAGAGFSFMDRDANTMWQWYANGGATGNAYLYRNGNKVVIGSDGSITSNGNLTATGKVLASGRDILAELDAINAVVSKGNVTAGQLCFTAAGTNPPVCIRSNPMNTANNAQGSGGLTQLLINNMGGAQIPNSATYITIPGANSNGVSGWNAISY